MKRYVLAGTGARGLEMFARPMLNGAHPRARLVAWYDINPLRMAAANRLTGSDLPAYTDFDRMIGEVRPDGIIVASRDDTHAGIVIRSLEKGLRVYAEKPLCISLEQIHAIREAARQSQGACFVTHNARYNPARHRIREVVQSGCIGEVQHIEFRLNLDRRHGADYFRRWHKEKAKSGGLLIHKASHHFDVINWLAGGLPQKLRAVGGVYFYGKAGPFRGLRCHGCQHAPECEFHVDLQADAYRRELYFNAEREDGYLRDGCVFDPSVDAEDYASVCYTYDNGVRVTYTLCAYATCEGNSTVVQGTRGRIEHETLTPLPCGPESEPWVKAVSTDFGRLMLFDRVGNRLETLSLPPPEADGHGGSDRRLRADFFDLDWDAPRPSAMATLDEAVQAVLVGLAANRSIARGGAEIDVQSLLSR